MRELPPSVRCVLKALSAFVLEVLGGAGAVWGSSELFCVRAGPNNDSWRVICDIVGGLCLVRWFLLYVLQWKVSVEAQPFDVLAKFLLQVLGGAGAVWGFTEILGVRTNYPPDCHDPFKYNGIGSAWGPGYATCQNTYKQWRFITMFFFYWFFLWWQDIHLLFLRALPFKGREIVKRFCVIFSTFILQVIGAAGAVWGVAEVFGSQGHSLRLGWGQTHFGQETYDYWRYWAAVTFLLFLVRWVVVLMHEARYSWRELLLGQTDEATNAELLDSEKNQVADEEVANGPIEPYSLDNGSDRVRTGSLPCGVDSFSILGEQRASLRTEQSLASSLRGDTAFF